MRVPDERHPITITPHPRPVRVIVAGTVIAESGSALALAEASYPPVLYLPRDSLHMPFVVSSTKTTHCPYKGDASYFDIVVGDTRRRDAVWSYETPFPAVEAIKGHVAFYPDRVDTIEGA